MTGDNGGSAEPIIDILKRGGKWAANKDLAEALGFVDRRGTKSVVGHWPDVLEQLNPADTVLRPSGLPTGGQVRFFAKRAVVTIALRARTPNARAFQRWLAAKAAETQVWHS